MFLSNIYVDFMLEKYTPAQNVSFFLLNNSLKWIEKD